MAASFGGRTEMVRMLLDKGANAAAVDESGYSPSALAAINGSLGAVRLLKAAGDQIRTPWDVLSRE
ncbi:MAG: ankyrin repeat domain-containing protein [Deltaproteobacteria bacterium]|nr:ankyrin repeat domain-containing protein [Deltaproteobacteria bacterium]